jgi:hypothetical protein
MPRTVKARFDEAEALEPLSAPDSLSPALRTPAPLYQHPAVACSIILVAGAVVQIAVWLVCMRLASRPANPSSLVVHGLLQELVRGTVGGGSTEAGQGNSILFGLNVLLGLFSGVAWYGVGRLGLGPKWGLWVGLIWVVHPSFAFLANQAGKFSMLITALPTIWCLLLWWRRSRSLRTALSIGLLSAITCFMGFQGLLLLMIALPAMALSTRGEGRRVVGVASALIGFAVGIVILAIAVAAQRMSEEAVSAPTASVMEDRSGHQADTWPAALETLGSGRLARRDSLRLEAGLRICRLEVQLAKDVDDMATRLETDLWNEVDDASGSPMAIAARNERAQTDQARLPACQFLAEQFRKEPRQSALWLAGRFWRSIYATADGRTSYPVVLVHFGALIPALWGLWIAFRYRPWRWLAVTGGLFTLSQWVLAAVAEPLARNMIPVGGFSLLFALVGVTDIYERLFGRRLTAPAPASQPARLRRMQRNLDG